MTAETGARTKRLGVLALVALLGAVAAASDTGTAAGAEGERATVVLLHGLGRSERSMARLAGVLEAEGFRAVNLGYPSRAHTIRTLADTLAVELDACCADADTLHFVTHSLGGILVRIWEHEYEPENLGRVVMLSPPNQGSDVAERLPDRLLELVMGPASVQLGTDSASVPLRLPPADFELGIITGDASLNPLFSSWLPGDDDGLVAVESAWVEGADDFLVVPYTHTFIMYRERVMEEVVAFLRNGRFSTAHEQ
ncbi:MAG: alpha/beta fold hydrolase [Longimicrobiales bacterium]|nr:alpha/beta fold hydrolase [Longimicrobiales bacterium]